MGMVPQPPQVQAGGDITAGARAWFVSKEQARHFKELEEQAKRTHAEAVRAAKAGEQDRAAQLAQEAEKIDFQKRRFATEQFMKLMDAAQDPQKAQAAMAGLRMAGIEAAPGVHAEMPAPGAPMPVTPGMLPPSRGEAMVAPGEMGGITPESEEQLARMQAPFEYKPVIPRESGAARDVSMVAPGLGLAPLMMGAPEAEAAPETSLDELMLQAMQPVPETMTTTIGTPGETEFDAANPYDLPGGEKIPIEGPMVEGGREIEFDLKNPYDEDPTGKAIASSPMPMGGEKPVKGFGDMISNMAMGGEEQLGITEDADAIRVAEQQVGNENYYSLFYEGELLGHVNTTGWTPETKAALGMAIKGLEEEDATMFAKGAIAAGANRKEVLQNAQQIAGRIARGKRAKTVSKGLGKGKPGKKEWAFQKEHNKEYRSGQKLFDKYYKEDNIPMNELSLSTIDQALLYLNEGKSNSLVKAAQVFIAKSREPGNNRMTDRDVKLAEGELSAFEEVLSTLKRHGNRLPQVPEQIKAKMREELTLLRKQRVSYMKHIAERLEAGAKAHPSRSSWEGYTETMDARLKEKYFPWVRRFRATRKSPEFPFSEPATVREEYKKTRGAKGTSYKDRIKNRLGKK
jgi:hypothetical protein